MVIGAVFNRNQRDSGAAEPRETVSGLQVLPVPLSGDGRGQTRLRQRTFAGTTSTFLLTHHEQKMTESTRQFSKKSFVTRTETFLKSLSSESNGLQTDHFSACKHSSYRASKIVPSAAHLHVTFLFEIL